MTEDDEKQKHRFIQDYHKEIEAKAILHRCEQGSHLVEGLARLQGEPGKEMLVCHRCGVRFALLDIGVPLTVEQDENIRKVEASFQRSDEPKDESE